MRRLNFTCPKTGRMVDVGVDSEISTLLRIRSEIIRAECPACGETHEWSVKDATLTSEA